MRGREIIRDQTKWACSPAELRLLLFFLRYPEIIFSRIELFRRVCSDGGPRNSRIIDVLVHRIRAKIETASQSPLHLLTVRGLGYTFQHNSDIFIDSLTRGEFIAWPCCS
jgi:DNA-binding response OmpR family regulator